MSRLLRFLWTATALALGALRRNTLRSVLTAFGILIGVAAVTIVVALGEGASLSIQSRIDSLGNNALVIFPEETSQSGARTGEGLPLLTEDDATALEREASSIAVAVPTLMSFSQVAWGDANSATQIIGSTRGFFQARAWKLKSGQLWNLSSENVAEKVCVIGSTVASELFGDLDPIGRTLRIGRHPFVVIGLLESKGHGPFGQDQDDMLVMPISTTRSKLVATRPGQVTMILVSASSADASAQVMRDATAILRQRHHLSDGAENDFRIRSQEEFRKTQEQILGVLSALLLSIAAVSLVVGGIGVMNIMLVSVAERTREIGIRMAIGARENDILVQFLVEAIVLSVAGGLIGAGVAVVAVAFIGRALEWPMSVSPQALIVALTTSSLVGVLFGFVPARRAARLDPIHALHRE